MLNQPDSLYICLLNSIPSLVSCLDIEFKYIFVNKAYETWFDIDSEKIKGKFGWEVIGQDAFLTLKPLLERALKGEKIHFEKEILYKKYGKKFVETTFTPYRNEKNDIIGIFIVTTDRTDLSDALKAQKQQEELLKNVLDAIPVTVGYWDKNLISRLANKSYLKDFGKNPEDILGCHISEILGEDLYKKNQPLLSKALQGEEVKFVREIKSSLGVSYHLINYSPLYSQDKIEGVVATVTNVTDITEKNIQIENMMKNSPGVIYQSRINKYGVHAFTFISEKCFEVLGVKPDELYSDAYSILDLVDSIERDKLRFAIRQSYEKMIPMEWSGEIVTRDKKVKNISVQGIPRKAKNESIIWDGIMLDTSKEVELLKQIDEQKVKALEQSKLASLAEIYTSVTHEINNPLAIISGNIEVLSTRDLDSVSQKRKYQLIKNGIKRISDIVSNLKRFSQADGAIGKSPHRLNETLVTTIKLVNPKATKEGIFIIFEEISNEIYLNYDETLISQVFLNLINNSIDAIKKQAAERWIRININILADFIEIEFVDSGKGIDSKIMNRIFDPFFSTKNVGEGQGLGLSVAKGIINDHGGDIVICSAQKNTCFKVTLPR